MIIQELDNLTLQQRADLTALMEELDSTITVTGKMLEDATANPSTHFFAAIDNGHIVGCASLCVTVSPTGRKGGIEDVVVSSACRGRGIGRALMDHIIDYARTTLAPIDLHLTSRPAREAANRLYAAIGFQRYETNVYKFKLR